MLERLYNQYRAMPIRNKRMLIVALILVILLLLNRTVFQWLSDYEKELSSQQESLQAQLDKIDLKIDSKPNLETKKNTLLKKLTQETELLLPYESAYEAQNIITACLQNIATQNELRLSQVRPRNAQDIGDQYQKISVEATTMALPQNWMRFLHVLESLKGSGSKENEACPPLPLVVEDLSVKVMTGRDQHSSNVTFVVSGMVRKKADASSKEEGGQ